MLAPAMALRRPRPTWRHGAIRAGRGASPNMARGGRHPGQFGFRRSERLLQCSFTVRESCSFERMLK